MVAQSNSVLALIVLLLIAVLGGGMVYFDTKKEVSEMSYSALLYSISLKRIIESEPKGTTSISVLAFGDMMLGRAVGKAIKSDIEPLNPFTNIIELVDNQDFITANMEGPITARGELCSKLGYVIYSSPEPLRLVSEAGMNILSLANNHSWDCGREGYLDTQKILRENNIDYFGGQNIEESFIVKNTDAGRVGFVGIEDFINPDGMSPYYKFLEYLDSHLDFIIVSIHWGDEYKLNPSSRQVKVGHKLIESGADVVIGHHPHVVQPVEIYRDGIIFYSLGNFIFDQIEPETKKGLAVDMVLDTDDKDNFKLIPFDIVGMTPTVMSEEDADLMCNRISPNNKCEFVME